MPLEIKFIMVLNIQTLHLLKRNKSSLMIENSFRLWKKIHALCLMTGIKRCACFMMFLKIVICLNVTDNSPRLLEFEYKFKMNDALDLYIWIYNQIIPNIVFSFRNRFKWTKIYFWSEVNCVLCLCSGCKFSVSFYHL